MPGSQIQLDERFVQRMQRDLDSEAKHFLIALETDVPTSVFINAAKDPGQHFVEHASQVPWSPNGRYLDQRPDFTFDPLFHDGCYYVMEASSMFIQHVITSLIEKDSVTSALDLCAAPGGKSIVMLSSLPKDSLLVTNEVNKSRFQTLQYNLDKWGAPNVVRTSLDPERIPWSGCFDLILVDAPCSGEGLFRKDKEARTEWSPANVTHCSLRQRRILTEAIRLLAPGGYLIYSTCTFNDEENIDQIDWMFNEFGLMPRRIPVNESWNIEKKQSGESIGYQFYPHKVKGEGFFCAVMQKPSVHIQEEDRLQVFRGNRAFVSEIETPKSLIHWFKPDVLHNGFRFFESAEGEYFCLHIPSDIHWLNLREIKYPGTLIGSVIGEVPGKPSGFNRSRSYAQSRSTMNITPSHALALSQCLSNEIPSVELDLDQALKYLRKEPVSANASTPGWNIARYNGHALGWLKQTQAGLKNYLPTKYRIIKQ